MNPNGSKFEVSSPSLVLQTRYYHDTQEGNGVIHMRACCTLNDIVRNIFEKGNGAIRIRLVPVAISTTLWEASGEKMKKTIAKQSNSFTGIRKVS